MKWIALFLPLLCTVGIVLEARRVLFSPGATTMQLRALSGLSVVALMIHFVSLAWLKKNRPPEDGGRK